MWRTRGSLLCVGVALLATARVAAESPPWTLEQLRELRLPHVGALEAEARLAEAERALAGSSGLLREGVTLIVLAGLCCRDSELFATDVLLGLEMPILWACAEQRAVAVALAVAVFVLRGAARAEAEREVLLAGLDVWLV